MRSDPEGPDLSDLTPSEKVGSMQVRLSDAALSDEFVRFLRRADCIADIGEVAAHAEGIAVEVGVPRALDDAQARLEVALYLRVWEAVHPGSGAELLD
jgi:hypothetical protein